MRRSGLCAVLGVVLALSACTSEEAGPITEALTSNALPATTTTSTATSTTTSSSASTTTNSPSSTAVEASTQEITSATVPSGPWPADLSPEQVADAQAALTAYLNFYQVVDSAVASPQDDWTGQLSQFAADPILAQLLDAVRGTAALGQYGSGTTSLTPVVTSVVPGVVSLSVCVDSTGRDLFDASGQSIKAPDASGSFWRHQSEVEVWKYESGVWRVTLVKDDWATAC